MKTCSFSQCLARGRIAGLWFVRGDQNPPEWHYGWVWSKMGQFMFWASQRAGFFNLSLNLFIRLDIKRWVKVTVLDFWSKWGVLFFMIVLMFKVGMRWGELLLCSSLFWMIYFCSWTERFEPFSRSCVQLFCRIGNLKHSIF